MTQTLLDEPLIERSAYRRQKRAWLIAIAAVGFVDGLCAAYFGPRRLHNPFTAPFFALYLLCIFGWYHADSDERGFPRGLPMNFLVLALAAVGIPVYLFRTRGFARGLLGITLALLMVLVSLVAAMLGAVAVLLAMPQTL